MRSINYLFVLIIFLFSKASYGQTVDEVRKRINNSKAVTPDIAAFQKYSYFPVSLNTGVVNISIPLFTVETGDLKHNVSLDYHTGGIKVNERSTKVGLGWLLNAGGMITRAVQGALPDEFPNGYLAKRSLLPAVDDPNLTGVSSPEFNDFCYDIIGKQKKATRVDLEPDLFTYKFGDKSGVFYFTTDGKIVNEGLETLKIETDATFDVFKITDENGVAYLFEIYHTSTTNNSTSKIDGASYAFYASPFRGEEVSGIPGGPDDEQSSLDLNFMRVGWDLTKIVHPNLQDTIFFDYKSVSFTSSSISQYLEYPYKYYLREQGSYYGQVFSAGIFETITRTEDNERYLEKIRCGNKTITFKYDADRKDTNVSPYRLSSVVTDVSSKIMQTITLDNNIYFDAKEGQLSNNSGGNNSENKRLKLRGLSFQDADKSDKYSYRFAYNEEHLPIVNATAQDYWGYFNRELGNSSLIPRVIVPAPGNSPDAQKVLGNANRLSHEGSMKAFSLEKIYYPTGGMTSIEYDAHKIKIPYPLTGSQIAIDIGGLRVNRMKLYKDASNLTDFQVKRYVYSYAGDIGYGRLIANRCVENNFGMKMTVIFGASINYLTISSSPVNSFDIPGYSTVEYDSVREYDEDMAGQNNGYKQFDYSASAEPNVFYPKAPVMALDGSISSTSSYYVPFDLGSFIYDYYDIGKTNIMNGIFPNFRLTGMKSFYPLTSRPLLIKEGFYNKHGVLINETEKRYIPVIATDRHVVGFAVSEFVNINVYNTSAIGATKTPAGLLYVPGKYSYFRYEIPIGVNRMTTEISRTLIPETNAYISQTTNYEYEPLNGLLRRSTKNNSAGKLVKDELWYPFDYSNQLPVIDSLNRKHILATPILSQKIIGNTTVAAVVNQFDGYGNLSATYSLKEPVPYLSQFPTEMIPATGFEKQYNLFYRKGRLSEVNRVGGSSTTYLWGYKNLYPIAEIVNAKYIEIENVLGGAAAISNFNNYPFPDTLTVNQFLAPLRSNLSSALVITNSFVHGGMVGSQIDAKGSATYYGYDGFQRLIQVKDQKKNIIKHYSYYYSKFHSVAKNREFTRNNCGSGSVGTTVNYMVEYGKYTSSFSQADADSQAEADLNSNGQNFANTYGQCIQTGITLVNRSYATGVMGVHIFQDRELFGGGSFPQGYGSTSFLNNIGPGVFKIQCQAPSVMTFTVAGISKTGANVTFDNVTIPSGGITITVE